MMLFVTRAGMGVDSGLPDFRDNQGFWRAYPALGRSGIDFNSAASPRAFRQHPELAWGFYGHRLNLSRPAELRSTRAAGALAFNFHAPVIRINPQDATIHGTPSHVGLTMCGLEALQPLTLY